MSATGSGRLRVAVVGVGHFGRHHARILSGLSGVHLEAVVDIDAARAETVASETGTSPETDVAALAGRVDAVTLAVPTASHHAVALPLLERGVSVLVEKPMARSVAEADEMIAAAQAGGAVLAIGHTERHNPAVTAALPLVRSPRFIEVHRIGAFPGRSLDIDVIFDVMIHDLDILLAVVGAEVTSIEAVGVPVLTDRVDIANARISRRVGLAASEFGNYVFFNRTPTSRSTVPSRRWRGGKWYGPTGRFPRSTVGSSTCRVASPWNEN